MKPTDLHLAMDFLFNDSSTVIYRPKNNDKAYPGPDPINVF